SNQPGGQLPPGNYYVGVSAFNARGETSIPPDPYFRLPVVLTQTAGIDVTWQTDAAATGYNIYVGRSQDDIHLAGTTSGSSFTVLTMPSSGAPTPTIEGGAVLDPTNVTDRVGHGTTVAGIAAETSNNAVGA